MPPREIDAAVKILQDQDIFKMNTPPKARKVELIQWNFGNICGRNRLY